MRFEPKDWPAVFFGFFCQRRVRTASARIEKPPGMPGRRGGSWGEPEGARNPTTQHGSLGYSVREQRLPFPCPDAHEREVKARIPKVQALASATALACHGRFGRQGSRPVPARQIIPRPQWITCPAENGYQPWSLISPCKCTRTAEPSGVPVAIERARSSAVPFRES